jgi:hypothetical protein
MRCSITRKSKIRPPPTPRLPRPLCKCTAQKFCRGFANPSPAAPPVFVNQTPVTPHALYKSEALPFRFPSATRLLSRHLISRPYCALRPASPSEIYGSMPGVSKGLPKNGDVPKSSLATAGSLDAVGRHENHLKNWSRFVSRVPLRSYSCTSARRRRKL